MKFLLIIQALLIGLSYSKSVGKTSLKRLGIINGTPSAHRLPYEAILNIIGQMGPMGCGGSLISQNYVLTSAFCVYKVRAIDVILGAHNRSNNNDHAKIQIKAASWIYHEHYQKNVMNTILEWDVGLVKLSRPAPLSNYITTIKLSPDYHPEGTLVQLYGWGLLGYWDESPDVPMKIDAKIISNKECKTYFAFIQDFMMCTMSARGGGYCNGDQGSPLVFNGEQIGITSFGDKMCEYYKPTYYSRITSFLSWIKQHSDYKG